MHEKHAQKIFIRKGQKLLDKGQNRCYCIIVLALNAREC